MKKFDDQKELNEFLASKNWDEIFIREIYCVNPSYIQKNNLSVVAPDSPGTLRMLFSIPDREDPGFELIFEDAENIHFEFKVDLNPYAIFENNRIFFSFFGPKGYKIEAKALYYRNLTTDSWGWDVNLGLISPFDQAGIFNPTNIDI